MKRTPSPPTEQDIQSYNDALDSQENLMKAAQRFALAFDQNRKWADDIGRLDYMIATWRELAVWAVRFTKHNFAKHDSAKPLSQQPEDQPKIENTTP